MFEPPYEQLREMKRSDRAAFARQSAADLHQTTGIAGNYVFRAGGVDGTQLVLEHGARNIGIIHREGSAEAAASRCLQLHKLKVTHRTQQPARRIGNPQTPQHVTPVMICDTGLQPGVYVVPAPSTVTM